MRAGRLLLFAGGVDGVDAPLAGSQAEAFPAELGVFSISAPLAGSPAEAFAAAFVFGQSISAPLAGVDAEAYPAGLTEAQSLLAPLAGTDALAYGPASLPFNQSLLAPLAGDAAVVYPATLAKDQFLLAPLAGAGSWVFPAQVLGTTEVAALAAGGMTVKVLDRASLSVLATLSLADSKSFVDQVDDTGSGTVTVPNDDTSDTDFDRLLQFNIGGQPRFLSVIEDRDIVTLSPNGAGAQQTTLNGRGALALLGEGTVGSPLGDEALPIIDVRSFSVFSPDKDITGWGFAKQLAKQSATTEGWDASEPEGWPEPDAWRIWADDDAASTSHAPTATHLFAEDVTIATSGTYALFSWFDNTGEFWVDGARVVQSGSEIARGRRLTITLSAGVHRFAAIVRNGDPIIPGSGNPGGFAATLHPLDAQGLLEASVWSTSSTTRCLPNVTGLPGFTVGQVLITLLEEAQAEDACLDITWDFTATQDSEGNAWEVETEITVDVGRSLLEVVKQMAASSMDVAMAPGALVLRAYQYGGRGSTKAVTLVEGSNLASLRHQGKRATVNSVRVRYDGGWLREEDAVSIASIGRREVRLDLGGVTSADKAREEAQAIMALRKEARYAGTADADPVNDAERQLLDALEAGDWITCDNQALTPEVVRVREHVVTETQDGRVDHTVRLNDVREEAELRFARHLERMAPGALLGGSRVSSPAGAPPIADEELSPIRVAEFSFEGEVADGAVVNLLLNGAVLGSVTFSAGELEDYDLLDLTKVHVGDQMQIQVAGVKGQERPVDASGNLIQMVARRTIAASASETDGLVVEAIGI